MSNLKIVAAGLLGLAALFALSAGWYVGWLRVERAAITSSVQYHEGALSALRAKYTEYHRTTNPALRSALVIEMQRHADKLPSSDIPPDIAALLGR